MNNSTARTLEDRLGNFPEAWKPTQPGEKLIGELIDMPGVLVAVGFAEHGQGSGTGRRTRSRVGRHRSGSVSGSSTPASARRSPA